MNKRIIFSASVVIQLITLILLATGSGFLLKPFMGTSLPWGNLLSWLLLFLFPINFLMVKRTSAVHPVPRRVFYICVCAGVVMGGLWLFVSYLLAGNWSASFRGGWQERAWSYYTYTAAMLPFTGYFLMRLLMAFFKAGAK